VATFLAVGSVSLASDEAGFGTRKLGIFFPAVRCRPICRVDESRHRRNPVCQGASLAVAASEHHQGANCVAGHRTPRPELSSAGQPTSRQRRAKPHWSTCWRNRFDPGETASTQDLLYGLLLKSGNDAAETLAEAAGGSIYGFADLMNTKAWQIGARNSHFANPHGLPDEDHYSTAYDLALIFRHAMNYPMFADIVRTRSAALRIESGQGPYGDSRLVSVLNHNRLLASYEGARGGKTGFTIKARRCFVGEVDRGGIRLIVSILNSPNSGTLWQDARSLLDYGFAHYGLAPPPPAQPDIEPQPILVRHTPISAHTDHDARYRARGHDPVSGRR